MITKFKIFESKQNIQDELLIVFYDAIYDEYGPDGKLRYNEEKVNENFKKLDNIINRGADINYRYKGEYKLHGMPKKLNETLINYNASQSNSLTYVDWLTTNGADWNATNTFGYDFLEVYVRLGRKIVFNKIKEKYPENFREYVWTKIENVNDFSDNDFGPSRNGFGPTTKDFKGALDTIEYVQKFCPDLLDKIKEVYPDKYERWEMSKETEKYNL